MQYILPNCYRFLLSLPINNKNYYSPKKLLFDCSFRMSHSVSSTTTTTKSITTATTTTTTATTTNNDNNNNKQWQPTMTTTTMNDSNSCSDYGSWSEYNLRETRKKQCCLNMRRKSKYLTAWWQRSYISEKWCPSSYYPKKTCVGSLVMTAL